MARAKAKARRNAGPDRFDAGALLGRAGSATFDRGKDYFRRGTVRLVAVDSSRVVATVDGTETYRVTISGGGSSFISTCTCPAFAGMAFCKHVVATALTVNDASADALAEIEAKQERLRAYLRGLGVEALVELVLRHAAGDESLREELDRAILMSGDDENAVVDHFLGSVDAALEAYDDDHGWDDRETPPPGGDIDSVLDGVEALIARGQGAAALRVLTHMLDESDKALERDHEGELHAAMARAARLHVAACGIVRPDPVEFAREVFERELRCPWDFLGAAEVAYADVLGASGRAEFRRLAEAAYAATSGAGRRSRAAGEAPNHDRRQLRGILERMAESEADIDAAVARRAGDAERAYDYYLLATWCRDRGRAHEALKWAEEGVWRFESDPDFRLNELLADLLADAGRQEEARKILWDAFARQPAESVFQRIRKLANGEAPNALFDKAETLAAVAPKPNPSWRDAPTVLLRIAVAENLFDDAWRLAEMVPNATGTHKDLARATQSTHPAQALAFWLKEIHTSLRVAAGQYDHVVEMIERAGAIRAATGEQAAHAANVLELMKQHKAKRNFIKAMNAKGYR